MPKTLGSSLRTTHTQKAVCKPVIVVMYTEIPILGRLKQEEHELRLIWAI
jgi:hypothetical protein